MSDEIIHFPLAESVRVVVQENREIQLTYEEALEIEALWNREKVKRSLVDTFIFSVTSFDSNRIYGSFVQYRYFLAGKLLPELHKRFRITPLAIGGLSICNGGVLLGVRDVKLENYGGFIECVPSGIIEARAFMQQEVDYMAQGMWKLQEQTGISEKKVKEVRSLGLFFNQKEHLYTIGLKIGLDLFEQEMELEGSKEYPLLDWYTYKECKDMLDDPENKVTPLTRTLLTLLSADF
jgi:hypothetical protein